MFELSSSIWFPMFLSMDRRREPRPIGAATGMIRSPAFQIFGFDAPSQPVAGNMCERRGPACRVWRQNLSPPANFAPRLAHPRSLKPFQNDVWLKHERLDAAHHSLCQQIFNGRHAYVAYEIIRHVIRYGGGSFFGQRARSRIRKLQESAFLRCRLDRHHLHDCYGVGHSGGAGLCARRAGAVGAGDLCVAEGQEHRRVPGQLDADHGSRHQALSARTSRSRRWWSTCEGAKYTLAVPSYTYESRPARTSPTSPSSRTSWTTRSTASRPAMTATASSST